MAILKFALTWIRRLVAPQGGRTVVDEF